MIIIQIKMHYYFVIKYISENGHIVEQEMILEQYKNMKKKKKRKLEIMEKNYPLI